jgi:hypothetical protein
MWKQFRLFFSITTTLVFGLATLWNYQKDSQPECGMTYMYPSFAKIALESSSRFRLYRYREADPSLVIRSSVTYLKY